MFCARISELEIDTIYRLSRASGSTQGSERRVYFVINLDSASGADNQPASPNPNFPVAILGEKLGAVWEIELPTEMIVTTRSAGDHRATTAR